MTQIDMVPIHHLGLDAESWVPEETAASWAGQGWEQGRLPRLVEEEAAAAELAREEALAEADSAAEVAGAGTAAPDEPAPTGESNTLTPEEGQS